MMMRHLRDALLAMVPDWPRGELDRVVAQLERNCRPRAKRPRVVHTGRLVALGEALMNSVPPEGPLADEDLLAYRDGLMIALLATRPLRRRNFAAILIGEHLLWVGDRFVLVFTASETKTRTPLEMNIPDALVPRLKHYLARIRPCFPGAADHSALWAGFKRRGLSGQAVYEAITARTRAAFGHAVNPHLFRDCAVTTIAMTAPDQIGVAQDLLGHVSGRTTHAHYNQARAIDASRLYATVLAAAGSPADGRSATRHSKETDPCAR
jgi:integrase